MAFRLPRESRERLDAATCWEEGGDEERDLEPVGANDDAAGDFDRSCSGGGPDDDAGDPEHSGGPDESGGGPDSGERMESDSVSDGEGGGISSFSCFFGAFFFLLMPRGGIVKVNKYP